MCFVSVVDNENITTLSLLVFKPFQIAKGR